MRRRILPPRSAHAECILGDDEERYAVCENAHIEDPQGASGKNSRYFHTQKGMKQTHKGMKNHCFSRKHLFHTLKKHFIPLCNCCIP